MSSIMKLLAPAAAAVVMMSGCTLPGEQATGSGEDIDYQETVYTEPIQQKEDVINYKWALKPSVSCDNIITPDCSLFDMSNIKYKAYLYTSIISIDGKFGLIDLNGNMVVYPDFDNYYMMPTGQIVLSSKAEDGSTKICYLDDYLRRQEETLDVLPARLRTYYWSDSGNSIFYSDSEGKIKPFESDDTVAVCKAKISEINGEFFVSEIESDAYALADKNGLITDFDYEDCYVTSYGDPSETLIALKQNGLWGYFDESGNKVLDIKFYDMPSAYTNNAANSTERSHPNLFSEGFVAVQNEKGGGYYTLDGSLLIPMGTFRQVRPIQSGRAWVNVDGLWGVITLGEVSDLKMPKVTTTTTTTAASYTTRAWSQTTTTPAQTQSTTAATVVTTPAPVETTPEVTVTQQTETQAAQTTPQETAAQQVSEQTGAQNGNTDE